MSQVPYFDALGETLAAAAQDRSRRRWPGPLVALAAFTAAIVLGAVVLAVRFEPASGSAEQPVPPSLVAPVVPGEVTTTAVVTTTPSDAAPGVELRVTLTPRSGPGIRAVIVDNDGEVPIDISGWALVHVNGRPQNTFTFPAGTVAQPGGSVGFLQTVDTFSQEPCPPDDATHFWGCNVSESSYLFRGGIWVTFALLDEAGTEVARWTNLPQG